MDDKEGCGDRAQPREDKPQHVAQTLQWQQRKGLHEVDSGVAHHCRNESPSVVVGTHRHDEEGADYPAHQRAAEVHAHQHDALAIAGKENAETKGQHAAHEVVAIIVDGFTLRAHHHLYAETYSHQSCCPTPMVAVEQQTIDKVELEHQTEEPVGSRPDVVVGMGKEVVDHT